MDSFYADLRAFDDFDKVADAAVYEPLPDDWVIGLSDVVRSTEAIAQGRYKAVNMAGASVISAVMNACRGTTFPFVFGGDGASLAVPPSAAAAMRDALARTATWVKEEIGLTLRVAVLEAAAIRAAGHEIRVACYAPTPHVRYAMFTGGGMQWAEERMKQGDFALRAAPPGSRPDLEGLSCRWAPMRSEHGAIVSLLVVAGPQATPASFSEAVHAILGCVEQAEASGRPLPAEGPRFSWPPQGLDLEARAATTGWRRWALKLRVLGEMVVAILADGTAWKPGGIDLSHYRRVLSSNADFRKFDDGLRMTVDISPGLEGALRAILEDAAGRQIIAYGVHRQDDAIMTCIVPSLLADDHMHFIDGAGGGYARAAQDLKLKLLD